MSARHQGRHRAAHGGPGRAPQPVEGRHRSVAGRPAAVRPVLAAGGTVAAALTAIVLSGAHGPLGALFPERDEDPRPTTASASPRGGAPTATDLAQVAGVSSTSGGLGSSGDRSVFDVLVQQDLREPGMPVEGSSDAASVGWQSGTGLGAGGTPPVASTGVPSSFVGIAPWTSLTVPSTPLAVGNGVPVRTGTSHDARVAGPDGQVEPQSPTSSEPRSADDEAPADRSLVPVTPSAPALPASPKTATEPVIKAADPVVKAADPVVKSADPVKSAEPVVKAADPVVKGVEPDAAPVTKVLEPVRPAEPKVPEPVQDAARSVGQAVPAGPKTEELPAGTGADRDLPPVKLPG